MRKRVDEIPKYNEEMEPSVPIDESFNGAGYHKAVVLAIGESEEAIQKSAKRVTSVPKKLIVERSFEEDLKHHSKHYSKQRNKKPDLPEKKISPADIKANKRRANMTNLEGLRAAIHKTFDEDKCDSLPEMPLEVILIEDESRVVEEEIKIDAEHAFATVKMEKTSEDQNDQSGDQNDHPDDQNDQPVDQDDQPKNQKDHPEEQNDQPEMMRHDTPTIHSKQQFIKRYMSYLITH